MTPLLPLESFRRIVQWQPYHFFGLSNADVPVTAACDDVLTEYGWQTAQEVGRDNIRQAIESAENILKSYLGYAVAPQYQEVTQAWPRYYDNSRERVVQMDATGRWIAPRIPGAGYVQAVGIEALTLIGTATKSNPPVGGDTLVFSDQDGDGLDDTFTITLSTTVTDPDTVAVYFVAADRLDSAPVGADYRIEPVAAAISGGVLTVIGRIWTIVRPVLYQGVGVQPLDPGIITPAGPYAQSLAVYSRTTNPNGTTIDTSMATLIWETSPCHGWWCCCDGCSNGATWDPQGSPRDPAAVAVAVARASLRNARLGELGVGEAVYNATTGIWSAVPWDVCHEPDRFVVRFLAGAPLVGQQMSRQWQTTVARLALAEMDTPPPACGVAMRQIWRWNFDVGRSQGSNDEVYGFVTRELLNNPLGSRRGHIWAWQQIRNLRDTPGVLGF